MRRLVPALLAVRHAADLAKQHINPISLPSAALAALAREIDADLSHQILGNPFEGFSIWGIRFDNADLKGLEPLNG